MTIKLYLLLLCFGAATSFAQITSIDVQASGLTCSMCSNAILKSLQTLPFVAKINANVKTSTFHIDIKAGNAPSFDLMRKKVEDAGFFIANLEFELQTDSLGIEADQHTDLDGQLFHFMNMSAQTIQGKLRFRLLDKGFVPMKAWKKYATWTSMSCFKTGYTAACCPASSAKGTRVYHITRL
jgi:copper chaperone CopZ